MPTLNIDVNARVEKAKRDLKSLDREVLKISKSEVILEKELKKVGNTGPKAFRKIQSAAVRQAKAVNSAALQFKQLRAQMARLGADPRAIARVTSEFIRFRKEMERGVVGTTKFQKAQDRLKATLGATKRQLAVTATAANKTGRAAVKGQKSVTGLGHSLENLGSTAVLVAGPLSGIGSRLIAFGAIAKRGSLLVAALFTGLAAVGVFIFKSIRAFDALNLSLAKTEAILKATGKEANITAEFVEGAAAKIARTTLANLEDTRPIAAALLSFRGIDAGNLESILGLAQDISATGFTDFTNAAKLLGRVLEDPIANLDALRRVFVQLTPLQKEQITHLQNIGKGLEAADIIMDVLRDKFEGVGESQNIGLSGALDRLGQSWTHLLEDFGEGLAYKAAVKTVNGLATALRELVALRRIIRDSLGVGQPIPIPAPAPTTFQAPDWAAGFFEGKMDEASEEARRVSGAPPEEPKAIEQATPSRLEKALIDANTGIEESFKSLDAEREKLQRGFSLMSPEVLKLNEKYKGFDDITKILAGDFGDLHGEGLKIATLLKTTNDAFLDLGRRKEASGIFKETRTALEKYNDAFKRLIFLYDNGYISANNFLIKQRELRATLEDEPTSEFEKALINANLGIKSSLISLDAKREELQRGFSVMSPEILQLAEKFDELDDVVKILAGDFSGLNSEGRRLATVFNETNEAFLDLGRRKEAAVIINSTRTSLERYNTELKRVIFLYDNGYISLSNLIAKQKELRATLDRATPKSLTPELKALNGALEKFSNSLADLTIKGNDFAEQLKKTFKSLVDDILKQFLKLAVINPILNGIFGESPNRPQLGSQGGGPLGLAGAGGLLGGSGGLLGRITGRGQDAPEEVFNKTAENFDKAGIEAVDDYGDALHKTNVNMEKVGGDAASDLGGVFSNMASGMASAAGGAVGSFLGHKVADLLGFQHGGSFKVGGSGGKDSQLVAFKASPREKVSIETPGQQGKKGNGNVTYIDARGVDPGQMNRLIQVVKDLDESVEVRAINATADARDRNPSLFGRTL